jgi:hypothetical protein
MVETATGRSPNTANIDCEVGRLDNGRIPGADDFAIGEQNVQYGYRPCVIRMELASVSNNDHKDSNLRYRADVTLKKCPGADDELSAGAHSSRDNTGFDPHSPYRLSKTSLGSKATPLCPPVSVAAPA